MTGIWGRKECKEAMENVKGKEKKDRESAEKMRERNTAAGKKNRQRHAMANDVVLDEKPDLECVFWSNLRNDEEEHDEAARGIFWLDRGTSIRNWERETAPMKKHNYTGIYKRANSKRLRLQWSHHY